jgi:hypothetical protein
MMRKTAVHFLFHEFFSFVIAHAHPFFPQLVVVVYVMSPMPAAVHAAE